MPRKAVIVDKLKKAMPKFNILEEIRGQHKAKERDTEVDMEITEKAQAKKELEIVIFKQENANKRKEIIELLKTDEYMINEVLGHRPKDMTGLLNATAETAVDVMHQRVCMARRRVDFLAYLINKRRQTLRDLEFTLQHLIEHDLRFVDNEQLLVLRQLQNNIDKMKIKYDAVFSITRQYEKLKNAFTAEKRWFPGRLKELNELIYASEQDLKLMHIIYRRAVNYTSQTVKELAEVDQGIQRDKQLRDEKLKAVRLVAAGDVPDDKHPHGELKRQDSFEQRYREQYAKKSEDKTPRHTKMLELQRLFRPLQEVLETVDVQEVLHRLANLATFHKSLNDKKLEGTIKKDTLREELNRSKDRFSIFEYHLQPKRDREKVEREELQKALKLAQVKCLESDKHRQEREEMVAHFDLGVSILYHKLAKVDLTGAFDTQLGRSMIDDLTVISRKLLLLQENTSTISEQLTPEILTDNTKLYRHVLSLLPTDMLRLDVNKEPSMEELLGDKQSNNDKYLGYEEVKLRSRQLIETVTARRRRKSPKTRRQRKHYR